MKNRPEIDQIYKEIDRLSSIQSVLMTIVTIALVVLSFNM